MLAETNRPTSGRFRLSPPPSHRAEHLADKDRAGFATFLVLSALDVAPDAILSNYLESNHWNRRLVQGLLARLVSLNISPDVAMPLLEVRSGYLQASVETIEQEWGDTARFLNEALAIDVERVREHYLEEVN